MRDYSNNITNVFPSTNSSKSNGSFDADYLLSANVKASINVTAKSPFHHSMQQNQQNLKQSMSYNSMLNGDLSNNYCVSNNNGTHQNHLNGINYKKSNGIRNRNVNNESVIVDDIIDINNVSSTPAPITTTSTANRSSNVGSYSLFDAITNAMTTGNCNGTIYPLNDPDEINYINEDKLSQYRQQDSGQILRSHQPHQHQIHRNQYDATNLSQASLKNLKTPLINSTMEQSNGNSNNSNNWSHQYPSVNYKNSYLLWIGTPVAAR